MKIGIIDSGWGGVFFAKYLRSAIPQLDIIAALDQKNFPYGAKTLEEVRSSVIASTRFLEKRGVQEIVIACNTASIFVEDLEREFPNIFFIDIITLTVSLVTEMDFIAGKLLVLMTQCMKDAKVYEKRLQGLESRGICVEYRACPTLVDLSEIGWKSEAEVQECFSLFIEGEDSMYILLACTHFYGFREILENWKENLRFIDIQTAVIEQVYKRVSHKIENSVGSSVMCTNGYREEFEVRVQKKISREVKVEDIEW